MGTKQENINRQGADTKKKATERQNVKTTNGALSSNKTPLSKPTSMRSLIIWNISKALEINPSMDLKASLKNSDTRLLKETGDLDSVLAKFPEQQHLVCAMLAWQQLGHTDAESLYKFIESKRKEMTKKEPEVSCSSTCKTPKKEKIPNAMSCKIKEIYCCPQMKACKKNTDCGSFGSHSSGPVVKLPVETKVIMRLETPPQPKPQSCCPKSQAPEKETQNKINAACCLDSACEERLAVLDATTQELRVRAGKLAQREAERVELLERAEAAWKDLELGYLRRLSLAEEKEEDINRQLQKLIADRNEYKNACTEMQAQVKDRGDAVDQERAKLREAEQTLCNRACVKLRLSEECAKGEATLAQHHCRIVQLERDLQYKEEQARCKLFSMENEAESARALTHEAERAMRAELAALKEQVTEVSKELLKEDELNLKIKDELEKLRKQKSDMVEDLEGCKTMCDKKMQQKVEVIQKRRDALNALKDQLMECRCKDPVDEMVEAKRTPSLAAMCRCTPEDRLMDSCSCTSLRSRVLTNLLADLFGGLQTELGGNGSQMPCQLLKCLEDKHNWDRASVVKTNLRNFFSQLLMGELDIAIATSIENYHAKWVGASCADAAKPPMDEEWQKQALEERAQKLATALAEQLFQDRAEQLSQQPKDIGKSGLPPCGCKPKKVDAAVFPCLTQLTAPPFRGAIPNVSRSAAETPAYWKRTIQDVSHLRMQIEDLKKESIKKEDLRLIEEKIEKIVKQASSAENETFPPIQRYTTVGETSKREAKITKHPNTEENTQPKNQGKSGVVRKRPLESNSILKKTHMNEKPTRQRKPGHGQTYAVNLCLCGPQKNSKNAQNNDGKSSWKQKMSRDLIHHSSSVRQTKPIQLNLPNASLEYDELDNKTSTENSCYSNCKCFHKIPSNTSIDKLLETLTKWKYDLADPQERCIKNIKSSFSKYSKNSPRLNNSYDSKLDVSILNSSFKDERSDFRPHRHKRDGNTQAARFASTESEYMGAVNLDKSNENLCKCIIEPELWNNKNEGKCLNGKYSSPIKCINSNACECKIYQLMQKDNKNSQTIEINRAETLNQIQGVQTYELLGGNKNTATKVRSQNNKQNNVALSETNSIGERTKLFSNNCEYYIKFLGVTLADIGNQKKSKSIIKKCNSKPEDIVVSKEKYVETRRKRQKKLPHMDTQNLLTEPNIIHVNESDHSGSFHKNKCTKCECNARFDELKSFLSNIFAKQIQCNKCKDEAISINSQSLRCNENSVDSRYCCNSFSPSVDDSKDLEENAFHLLEDHLKGKLEEFKSFSCPSACIPPEEEEKLFSAILKRVKQVISDCANETKCNCPGNIPADGSWNRAYGLLQEYLKIKIKRVQCLCVFNDNKASVLPDILEKVCTLIENDFQRLKDICKCENNNGSRKKSVRIEDLINPKELPEKDTTVTRREIFQVHKLNTVDKSSKQNSNKSIIVKENISLQVPPNLGMVTKSCDVMAPDIQNVQTTETDKIMIETKSNGVMYNSCDCCYFTEVGTNDDTYYDNMFATKDVVIKLYTDTVKSSTGIFNISGNASQKPSKFNFLVGADSMKTLPDEKRVERKKGKLDKEPELAKETSNSLPYIGCTVDCTCDGILGACVCMKSVVQANNDKIDSVYKEFLANFNNGNQDYSYIMQGPQNKENDVMVKYNYTVAGDIVDPDISPTPAPIKSDNVCVTAVNAQNEEDIVLKDTSDNPIDTIHQTTNTFDENISLRTTCSNSEGPLDWFECPIPINSDERASTVLLSNTVFSPIPMGDYKKTLYGSHDTVTNTSTSKSPQFCDCERVPICHVKMLVENIEKNLIESRCTCDSLVPKLCPVHSQRVS
ncbi:unnamed protein product [Chrysodeixis includens]|uniref:Uncharacterized protein n=1 Tax=Chrysodeixis includens TaxID=689277 RepID=A0A9P0BY15_CHRIL|nr:unnamed protein product [Chrysodeixis includens]